MRSRALICAGLLVVSACSPEDESATPITPPPATTTVVSTTQPTIATTPSTTLAPRLDRTPNAAAGRMVADIDALVAFGPRIAGSDSEHEASVYLLDLLLEITQEPFRQNANELVIELPTGETSRNVFASFGPGGTGSPHVVLGGHYDSIPGSPGADDNASGVSVLAELARRLADDPPADLTVMIIFFGAEEILAGHDRDQHHFGSRSMVERIIIPTTVANVIDYMVSVDQVGFGEQLLAVTFRDTSTAAADLLVEAGSEVGVDVDRVSRGDISDHEAYARVGIPAVFMWRPDNPAYHTPDDDVVRSEALLEDLAVLERFLALAAGR